MLIGLIGLIWGFSEATLFFLVPDIWLTWVVLHHEEYSKPTYLWTLIGAMLGGTLMYLWGMSRPNQVTALLDKVPAISENLIATSAMNLNDSSFLAMLTGSFSGTPYKLYASQAYQANLSLISFLAITIPARLARWIVLGLVTFGIKHVMPRHQSNRLTMIWMSLWILNYLFYFSVMEN